MPARIFQGLPSLKVGLLPCSEHLSDPILSVMNSIHILNPSFSKVCFILFPYACTSQILYFFLIFTVHFTFSFCHMLLRQFHCILLNVGPITVKVVRQTVQIEAVPYNANTKQSNYWTYMAQHC